ncbi:hypothetical protein I8J29_24495 [Paenibacillus sp. MWE-103]|uniref:Uncharacterized protein n=1 Tax=Paenibacillus artemisiicola TaxID=1172618 RepID=A0ABS3WG98_9BACL|nr:hypothetical protein [Paenibacillus artemisiicola]MBO7747349.1 hypothetical protein [Paenibacillus artemisiicola]
MNVVLSMNNMAEVLTLPMPPSEFSLPIPGGNEEFDVIGGASGVGKLNLPGLRGLKAVSLASIFPVRKYSFVSASIIGWRCVNIINRWKSSRQPIRIIVTTKEGLEVLNMACLIENFTYGVDRAGDIPYTLELKEFVIPSVREVR